MGADYKSKFKDINWTSDIDKELPIHVVYDKDKRLTEQSVADRVPGSEMPITIS